MLIETGKYWNPRLTPRLLSSRYYAGRAVVRETDEKVGQRRVQAYTALWSADTDRKWYELGTIWIAEELRGNGLRNELMKEALALAPAGTCFFLTTSVEAIMRSARELGFVPVTLGTDPDLLRWASEVGITERLPESVHPNQIVEGEGFYGRPEEGERWLFIRR